MKTEGIMSIMSTHTGFLHLLLTFQGIGFPWTPCAPALHHSSYSHIKPLQGMVIQITAGLPEKNWN